MDGVRDRPIGVLDVSILVAATAIGFGLGRACSTSADWADLGNWTAEALAGADPVAILELAAELWILIGVPVGASLAAGVVLIRLRGPRPPWRRAMGQPGVLACLWIALGVVAALGAMLISGPLLGPALEPAFGWYDPRSPLLRAKALLLGHLGSAFAVLASWGTAALRSSAESGDRPERAGWIDRLGRAIAASWLLATAFGVLLLRSL